MPVISENSRSPVEACVAWIDRQPEVIRLDICVLVAMGLPTEKPSEDLYSKPVEHLKEWLQHPCGSYQTVGRIVIFRSLVDFSVSGHFSAEQHKNATQNLVAAIQQGKLPGIRAHVEKKAQSLPFTIAQWERAAAEWEGLKRDELSDATLHRYADQQLVNPFGPS